MGRVERLADRLLDRPVERVEHVRDAAARWEFAQVLPDGRLLVDGTTVPLDVAPASTVPYAPGDAVVALSGGNRAAVVGNLSSIDWTDLAFEGGYSSYGVGYQRGQYRRRGGRVELRGLVQSIPDSASIGTVAVLPPGCRPVAREVFVVRSGTLSGRVDVHPDGQVRLEGLDGGATTTGWVSLSGIAFDAPSIWRGPWTTDGAKRILADTSRYLSFPSAIRLDSGRIVAAWSDQSTHYDQDFAHVVHSDDDGATWSTPVVVEDHPTFVRMPIALASLRERVALLTMRDDPPGRRGWLYVTTDVENWAEATLVDYGQAAGQWVFPCALAWIDDHTRDGLMLAVAYGSEGIMVTASTDAGASWSRRATVAGPFTEGWSEATITHLGGPRLMMLARRDDPHDTISVLHSADYGHTWTAPATIFTQTSGLPVATVMPETGYIVVTLRDMAADDYPQSWALGESRDGGRTWTKRDLKTGWMMYGQVVPLGADRAILVGASQDRSSSTNSDVFIQPLRWPTT